MSFVIHQDFVRGNPVVQRRLLVRSAIAAMVVVSLVAVVALWAYPKIAAPEGLRFKVNVPAPGPGIKEGSTVLLHGAEIGTVETLTPFDGGTVTMDLVVDHDVAAQALDDEMRVDFRPSNYFGITGVFLTASGHGGELIEGQTLTRTDAEDYTMSTMLEQGSLVVDGTLTTEIIDALDQSMRYADGLAPMIEAAMIFADRVARTQQDVPSVHLQRLNQILVEFPEFEDEIADALYKTFDTVYNRGGAEGELTLDVELTEHTDETLAVAGDDLFGAVGALLDSNSEDLAPFIALITTLSDAVPQIFQGANPIVDFTEAIRRLDGTFHGSEADKTLQLNVVLDSLPGVASPLTAMGFGSSAPSEGE